MSDTFRYVDDNWRNTPQFIKLFGYMTEKCHKKDRKSRQHKKHDRFCKYGGINKKQREEELRKKENISIIREYYE